MFEMHGKSKLPLIPGFVISKSRDNFHLPQCWMQLNGTRMLAEKKYADNNWLLNDGKILCFNAYFRQNVTTSETYQIRNVKILYYLADGTIQVVEPRTDNSGIPQGCIVKRQKVPCCSSVPDKCLSMADLNVQKQVKIFDKIFHITDCDGFTKSYLLRAGIEVPNSIKMPKDPIHKTREEMRVKSHCEKLRETQGEETKLENFLKFDNCCLKFDAYWDDRSSMSGDIHYLIVYYYLADGTIQVNEIPKQGRPTILCKRLKLPKRTDDVLLLDHRSNATVLNVLGTDFMNARCITDKAVGKPCVDCYTDKDLKIGQQINVYGRAVILTDCDKFTQKYYRDVYGIEEFVPIERPRETRYIQPCVTKVIPPYNGFGSYEDSEANCMSIQPKAPQRDMKKFLELDKCNLRFKAQIISAVDEDSDREFVVTYYLSDDTISVFEIGKRNSSCSGDFLKRSKCYLPNKIACSSAGFSPELYSPRLFYIGATVNLNGFEYRLIDADEFTLNYMESHPSKYQMANISSIMSKIKEAIRPIYKSFIGKFLGVSCITELASECDKIKICYDTTRLALKELLGTTITEHEIVTFLRFFSAEEEAQKSPALNRVCVQSLVQMALENSLWDDLQSLKEFIYDIGNNNGFISPAKLRTIIRGCRIPIKGILIDDMVLVLNKDSNGNIDLNDFLYFIDFKRCKAPPIQPINLYDEKDKRGFNSSCRPKLVDWTAFIAALQLEEILKQETE